MPKSKPPRKKHRPAPVTHVAPRWLTGRIYDYVHQIKPAIANDDALSVVWACRRLTDELQPLVVDDIARARAGGATWETIGEALGITGQAASRRYGPAVEVPQDPAAAVSR